VMSYVIGIMIVLSVVFSLLLGRAPEVSGAALTSGVEAVKMCFELMGTVALWNGIMRVAEKSGLVVIIQKLLSPVTGLLFRGLDRRSPAALSAISLNITANLLGLGAAATPMGLEAMKELDRINGGSDRASGYMIALVALNTASFQILPTTVAAIRKLAGSESPLDILPAVWVTSSLSVTAAVGTALLLSRVSKGGESGESE